MPTITLLFYGSLNAMSSSLLLSASNFEIFLLIATPHYYYDMIEHLTSYINMTCIHSYCKVSCLHLGYV